MCLDLAINPLSANFSKWLNTLKHVIGKLPTNCLSVFDYFVKLALKGLISMKYLLQYQVMIMMLILFFCRT